MTSELKEPSRFNLQTNPDRFNLVIQNVADPAFDLRNRAPVQVDATRRQSSGEIFLGDFWLESPPSQPNPVTDNISTWWFERVFHECADEAHKILPDLD